MQLASQNKLVREKYEIRMNSAYNYVCIQIGSNEVLNIDDIKQIIQDQDFLLENRSHFKRMVIAGKFSSIESDARKWFENESVHTDVEAYVIYNLAQRILFNMYKRFRLNKHPIKAFNSIEEAEKWLNAIGTT